MKTVNPTPLGAACVTLMPGDLRLLHQVGGRLGGVAGRAIQLATLVPVSTHNLEVAALEEIDFDTGVVQTMSDRGEDAEVILGQRGLAIVKAIANGNRTGNLLAGGVATTVSLPKDPIRKQLLDMQLAAIDERTAAIRWDFAMLRRSVVQIMELSGVPHSIVLAQCGSVEALAPGSDRDWMINQQRTAADVVAAALNLFTRPAPTFYPSARTIRMSPIEHIIAVRGGTRAST